MTRKQWAALSLSLLGAGIGGIIAAVALVDPFEVYHKATAFIPPITNGTQNYSNAGIAKNYEYDSVVIGSSMTENFTPSQLDRLFGGQFVKLPINGGSPFNHKQMMDLAFSSHDVRRVLYGMDIEALTYFYTSPKCEMPDYLYDNNLFNDVSYWFNKSVLSQYIPQCLSTLGQTDPDQRDTMYTWGDLYTYGRDAALAGVSISSSPVEQMPVSSPAELSQQSLLNVEHNILPYIQNHPDTQFIFFYPPYSLVQWYQFYAVGSLDYHLEQKEALTAILLTYPNVEIYDFQARTEWILDLNHYIDAKHYGADINAAMAEDIAAGNCRITDGSQASQTRCSRILSVSSSMPENGFLIDAVPRGAFGVSFNPSMLPLPSQSDSALRARKTEFPAKFYGKAQTYSLQGEISICCLIPTSLCWLSCR